MKRIVRDNYVIDSNVMKFHVMKFIIYNLPEMSDVCSVNSHNTFYLTAFLSYTVV